jgi:hypothetical protein
VIEFRDIVTASLEAYFSLGGIVVYYVIKVWRYQNGTYSEGGQTIQMLKEKGQKNKQRSTKHYTNPINIRGWTQVLRNGLQLIYH